jgi:MFS family permease
MKSINFRLLWFAGGASNLADGIGLAAAPLLAAALTRDPALVAGLIVAQRLPWLLFTLVAGAFVDRLDRRRVIVTANAVRAAALAGLGVGVLAGWENLAALYAAFFVLGVAETLVDNAALAILPAIVPKDDLERANGQIFATASATNELVGPPVGGALFAWTPFAPFLAGGLAFGSAAVATRGISGEFGPAERRPLRIRALISEIGEGLRWFWREPVVRAASLWAGAANLGNAATAGVLVLLAQDELDLGATGFGVLLGAGAVGGILGGLLAERVIAVVGRGGAVLVSNLLLASGFAGLALTSSAVVAGGMLALASASSMIGNVVATALRQAAIPSELLGRVTSAYRLIALGALPVGALLGGALARAFGLDAPFLAGSLLMVVTAFALLPVLSNSRIEAARARA